MQQKSSPWWRSIVFRSTLVFAGFLLAAVFITGYLVFEGTRKSLEASQKEDMHHVLDLAQLRLQGFAGSIGDDIGLLADNDPVRSLGRAADAGDTAAAKLAMDRIAFMLESFIRSRQHFAQARFLDAEGMERIRFDRDGDLVVQVPDSLLQSKAGYDYFSATMALGPGGPYFSAIDLNKEHGHIAYPVMPTVRAAAPVVAPSGSLLGMVIINADLRDLFSELIELGGPRGTFMLASPQGDLLLHPDTARTFRFEFGAPHTLMTELGTLILPHDSVMLTDGNYLLVRNVGIAPLAEGHVAAMRMSERDLLADLKAHRSRSMLMASSIAVAFVLLTLLYALGTRRRLARLTMHIENYAAGSTEAALPLDRNDEIGTMARSLRHMQARIDQRVAELEEARHKAEEADRRKQEFLANMSHEVRTPLNAIMGMADALAGSELDDAQREQLGIVQRSAKRLRGLVDDLLLHARIAEGRLPVKPVAVDLQRLLADVAQAHLPTAMAKGIALRSSTHGIPEVIHTDPLRVYQIIDNLVTNALKFTEHGHVDIALRVEQDGGGVLRITVSDTGPGIPADALQRIFERFERAAASEKEQGAGLGLAITHRLVELMQGRIEVESTVGVGSRFIVHLPLAVGREGGAVPVAIPADPALLHGLRVLYVEDVATNRQLMEHWAGGLGWELQLADGPTQALALCSANPFDLVLMDMDLGTGMRGSDLAMRIRGQARFRYVPMLALTAFVDEEQEVEAIKAGMNDRLTKPLDRAELIEVLAFWMGHVHVPDMPEPDTRPLEAQYDHNTESVLRALQQYRREFLDLRLTLRRAIAEGDAGAMARLRHKLRPHLQLLKHEVGMQLLDAIAGMQPAEATARAERMFKVMDRTLMHRQGMLMEALLKDRP